MGPLIIQTWSEACTELYVSPRAFRCDLLLIFVSASAADKAVIFRWEYACVKEKNDEESSKKSASSPAPHLAVNLYFCTDQRKSRQPMPWLEGLRVALGHKEWAQPGGWTATESAVQGTQAWDSQEGPNAHVLWCILTHLTSREYWGLLLVKINRGW